MELSFMNASSKEGEPAGGSLTLSHTFDSATQSVEELNSSVLIRGSALLATVFASQRRCCFYF